MFTPAILRILSSTSETIEDSWRMLNRYRADDPNYHETLVAARLRLDEAHALLRQAEKLLANTSASQRR